MDLIQQLNSTLVQSSHGYSSAYLDSGDLSMENELRRYLTVLKEIISYLESSDFSFQLGLASGSGPLVNIMRADTKLKQLIEICKIERSVAVFMIGHMVSLATEPFDTKYRNPYDEAVTAYLYAITTARTDLHHPTIVAASMLKNSHWPKIYIQKYLTPLASSNPVVK